MDENTIHIKETTPKLKTKKCKFLATLLSIFLSYGIYALTITSWLYTYDYFISFFTLVLSFIIMGIVRSKLRNISIPFNQREFQYSDLEISQWYISKELCL